MTDYGNLWFAGFWGLVVVLCATEWMRPAFQADADRSGRWPVNFGLGLLNGLIASVAPSMTVLAAAWAETHRFGLLNLTELSLWVSAPVTVLVLSFAQYAFHRLVHIYPPLWRVHQVHHSDMHLDATSALRFHPLELVATVLFLLPFVVLFGLPAKVTALYEIVQIVVGLLTHANLDLPASLERRARAVFITPVLHRFHHSGEPKQTDLNFGNVFSLWDRAFRTLYTDPNHLRRPTSFGLHEADARRTTDFKSVLLLKQASNADPRG